jgi:hypothetical protein
VFLTTGDKGNCDFIDFEDQFHPSLRNSITLSLWTYTKKLEKNGVKTRCFRKGWDIALPPYVELLDSEDLYWRKSNAEKAETDQERKILMFFESDDEAEDDVSKALFSMFQDQKNTGVLVKKRRIGDDGLEMLKAIFCFVKLGSGFATVALKAVFRGCIPVMIEVVSSFHVFLCFISKTVRQMFFFFINFLVLA